MKIVLTISLFFFILLTSCKKNNSIIEYPPATPPEAKVPQLITYEVKSIDRYLTSLSAKVIDSGSSKISEQGFIIDTVENVDINKNIYKFPITLDSAITFSLLIKDLPANKRYYLRVNGINKAGVGYGNLVDFSSYKEKIYVGNITLHSQQEVIDFGLNNYSRITGELAIDGPVTDLTPLLGLTVVEAGFRVSNTQLINLVGLDSLEYTGYVFANNFRIENNQQLESLSGLAKLKITRGYFYIINNRSLLNIDGLDKYTATALGDLDIRDCDKLTNIDGLKNLEFVGGDINLVNNSSLKSISGFKNLSFIGYRLSIRNNSSLEKLDGLEKINTLRWGFELTNNASLLDINGLGSLTTVTDPDNKLGVIIINGNSALKDISALNKITTADYVTIQNNDLLLNLNGLNNIESVTYNVKIENNSSLVNLSGLGKLKNIGNLEILNNKFLIDLNGLDNLNVISNNPSITIYSNKNLKSLVGLEHLIFVAGSITISLNPSITDFCPIKGLLSNGYSGTFLAENNSTNPSVNDIFNSCP